jgi:aarF domain-containing kinase
MQHLDPFLHYADQLTGHAQMSPEQNNVGRPAPFEMRESRVPSSQLGRIWQYGGLAASMAFGAAGEGLRRATGSAAGTDGPLALSAGNMERLVAKLSKMRGAALKLGQMMSFQG